MKRLKALAALLLIFLATGCSAPDKSPPDESTQPPNSLPAAQPTATQLADSLTSLDVSDLKISPSAAAAQEDLETIFAGMDGITPTVNVQKVIYDAETNQATATLEVSYDVGTSGWSYETTATFNYDDGWVLNWDPRIVHPELDETSRLRHHRQLPKRAPINDSTRLALVEERDLYQVGLDKSRLDEADWDAAADELAKLLDIDAANFRKKVAAGGPKQFIVGATVRQSEVPQTVSEIPGGLVVTVKAMVAPTDTFAVGLLGTAGHPTADMIKESEGKLWASDIVGLSGLQYRYEEQLRGAPEVRIDLVLRDTADEAQTEEFEEKSLFVEEAVPGKALEITLDRELQTKAEGILAKEDSIAAIVVIDPTDGSLLVAANSPKAGSYPQATLGKFAPGSTFKVVASLAMLREGYSATSKVSCPSSLTVSGYQIKNYSGYPAAMTGSITLTQALAYSCNTAFAAAGSKVSPEALHEAAASLGVGTDYDSGFSSNFGTASPSNNAIERAASMFGQGQVTMSPLGMAAVAASVASGKTAIPWLVKGQQASATAKPLSSSEASALRSMMQAVVNEGSAKALKGIMKGAKTGTAEFGSTGQQQTHGWMIAWRDDVAVAAFVEVGESGSASAGPLIAELFSS